jgi:hypothetical protein
MNKSMVFVTVSLFGLLVGCAGKKTLQSASSDDIPEWFSNVPQDQSYLYAVNTQSSQDMQLAIDKAATGARSEIGRQLETRLEGMQKKFAEETGTTGDAELLQMFTQAEKTVVNATLNGSRVKKSEVKKDATVFRAYVMVEYPVGAANAALMDQVKKNERLYTKYRSSEAFKELENEVAKTSQNPAQ